METIWSYLVAEVSLIPSAEKMQDELNDIGLGGWELVSAISLPGPNVSKFLVIFKRPNPSE